MTHLPCNPAEHRKLAEQLESLGYDPLPTRCYREYSIPADALTIICTGLAEAVELVRTHCQLPAAALDTLGHLAEHLDYVADRLDEVADSLNQQEAEA